MAMEYYGVNKGQTEFQATTGSSSGSTDIELRVDLTKFSNKGDVYVAALELINVVLKDPDAIFG